MPNFRFSIPEKILAFFLLAVMGVLMILSMRNDSATMDEIAHLPAGYSYLTQKDMRLNPEHPPLLKDLAALPLLSMKLSFPDDIRAWKEDINGQWDFGFHFLYDHGNPADKMIFWGRIPMVFVTLLLGFFFFRWIRELFGIAVGLFALFLFAFSPTFLAHGRLVTTDVGATLGAVFATYYFIKFLQHPSWKNAFFAGLTLGIAELLKFSLILLFPFFTILLLAWLAAHVKNIRDFSPFCGWCRQYVLKFLFIIAIFALMIFPLYQYHVQNYPVEKQIEDIKGNLARHQFKWLSPALASTAEKPILRAYAQYLLGVGMVFNRTTSGNTTYFEGEVSNKGWRRYFPTVYAIKEPLAFHFVTLFAFLYALWRIFKNSLWRRPSSFIQMFIREHLPESAAFIWLAIYWATSLTTPLNIGVRHLLPTFPFVILLASSALRSAYQTFSTKAYRKTIIVFIAILFAWQAASVLRVYPHFLTYFNELAGGPDNGYRITIDSNMDWGQDLRRLTTWVQKNKIEKIKVAYFGGGKPEYYLGEKFEGFRWEEPQKGWVAVSVTLLMSGVGEPAKGFDQPTGFFRWLEPYIPVAKIGYSIFVYNIQ